MISFPCSLVQRCLAPVACCLSLWFGAAPAVAEPVPIDEAPVVEQAGPALPQDEAPIEGLSAKALEAPARELVEAHVDADRRALLQHSYQARPPTWIQGAAMVNLGDHPTLDDPTAQAEQQLRTIEWLIEQRKLDAAAAGRPLPADDPAPAEGWRKVLPGHWLPWLKDNRNEILSASVALLLASWVWSLWPQRRRRRRRRRHRAGGVEAGVAAGDAPMWQATAPPAPAPLRQRRRRRRHRLNTLPNIGR